jgi:5-methylcytosine-specific restriction endonuclease McrBC regulatory subunit McrC
MILNNVNSQYSASSSPIYGILFDGAWLWEEYLWTILKEATLDGKNFVHPTNKDRKGGIRLFDNSKNDDAENTFSKCYRRIYPDFYRENTKPENDDFLKNDGVILDAKYKQLEKGLVRDDLYQIISYMHTMKIPTGGFIYPISSITLTERSSATLTDRSDEDETLLPSDVEVKKYHLAGLGGTVSAIGFPILQNAESYSDFFETMKKSESNLLEKMRQNKS